MVVDFVIRWHWQNRQSLCCQPNNKKIHNDVRNVFYKKIIAVLQMDKYRGKREISTRNEEFFYNRLSNYRWLMLYWVGNKVVADFVIRWRWQNPQSLSCQLRNNIRSLYNFLFCLLACNYRSTNSWKYC